MADLTTLPAPPAGLPPATNARAMDAQRARFGTAQNADFNAPAALPPTAIDFTKWPDYSDLYSKGLKQSSEGIVDPNSFRAFFGACGFAAPPASAAGTAPGAMPSDFEDPTIVRGGGAKLNGPQGAFALQPIGDDSQAFTVLAPPAPDSADYAVELIELYWASLLRDVAFTEYSDTNTIIKNALDDINNNIANYVGPVNSAGRITDNLLFRGGFEGETVGPHISQFCIFPTELGVQPVDQAMQTNMPGQDFMTDLSEWFNVQNGVAASAMINKDPIRRYMRTGRDLAAFTRIDELYQAYFIAYLVLNNSWQVRPNLGSPYLGYKNQKPFGAFGGPDIAATLGAVAKAALDVVWYQKWSVHLRHRPEAGGGLVHLMNAGAPSIPAAANTLSPIVLASPAVMMSHDRYGSYLLSQAFPEGSPTHPAYPTGHGTVAGACITVLKFFFDCNQKVQKYAQPIVPTSDGLSHPAYIGTDAGKMTISGELHKLAHNISFGHGIHAGIHWRSDTDASILLGEAVALKFLQDRAGYYREDFSVDIIGVDGFTQTTIKNF